ncbi:MAG: urease accessory protein UreF [Anaerovoracaceae bacterium]
MSNQQQFNLMQIAGGTFPSGGFSQSWGLETYVSSGKITDSHSFKEFLSVYLKRNIGNCEGPIVAKAYDLAQGENPEAILALETLSNGVKLTKESREGSLRMGKAFLRIMEEVLSQSKLGEIKKAVGRKGLSYPVAYGLVSGYLELSKEAALSGFVFSTVNALIQSGVKLIPLGNSEAQKVLYEMSVPMDEAVKESLTLDLEEISNFSPGLDIAGILHETLAVRLYMS